MPDPSGDLTSYAELAEVLAALPLLLREARRQRRLSQRAAGLEIGFSFATVSRIIRNPARPDDRRRHAVITLTRWLDNDTHFLWTLPLASLAASLVGATLALAVTRKTRKTKTEGDTP